ncbi:unnamed protein product, partial [Cyprideis torosa]
MYSMVGSHGGGSAASNRRNIRMAPPFQHQASQMEFKDIPSDTKQKSILHRIYNAIKNSWKSKVKGELDLEENDYLPTVRPRSLDALMTLTKFSRGEIKRLYRCFKSECPNGLCQEEDFKLIYARFFPPGANTNQYAHFLFRSLDFNGTGLLNFEDFLLALSMLCRGTVEDRLKWAFRLYDQDGDGTISREEFASVVVAIYGLLGKYAFPPITEASLVEKIDSSFQSLQNCMRKKSVHDSRGRRVCRISRGGRVCTIHEEKGSAEFHEEKESAEFHEEEECARFTRKKSLQNFTRRKSVHDSRGRRICRISRGRRACTIHEEEESAEFHEEEESSEFHQEEECARFTRKKSAEFYEEEESSEFHQEEECSRFTRKKSAEFHEEEESAEFHQEEECARFTRKKSAFTRRKSVHSGVPCDLFHHHEMRLDKDSDGVISLDEFLLCCASDENERLIFSLGENTILSISQETCYGSNGSPVSAKRRQEMPPPDIVALSHFFSRGE